MRLREVRRRKFDGWGWSHALSVSAERAVCLSCFAKWPPRPVLVPGAVARVRECDGAVGVVSDNVIRFPDGDYYCPNCGGRWFRLVDPFTSVLADVPVLRSPSLPTGGSPGTTAHFGVWTARPKRRGRLPRTPLRLLNEGRDVVEPVTHPSVAVAQVLRPTSRLTLAGYGFRCHAAHLGNLLGGQEDFAFLFTLGFPFGNVEPLHGL